MSDQQKIPFLREHQRQKDRYEDYLVQLNEFKAQLRKANQERGSDEEDFDLGHEEQMQQKSKSTSLFYLCF